MKTILISGGTGLIGSQLTEILLKKNYKVIILSRKEIPSSNDNLIYKVWNPNKEYISAEVLQNTDIVINLAGKNVGDKRWNEKFKKELYDSRVKGTRFLVNSFKNADIKPELWINASAAGYYGAHKEKIMTENEDAGDNFLSIICKAWEKEATKIENHHTRLCIFRIGVVIAKNGGILAELEKPVKFWAGAAIGSGNQLISWIDIDDLCNMFVFAIENENLKGIYNAVAPTTVSNKELIKRMAHHLNKPLLLPAIPKWAIKIIAGEMSEYVLGSLNVSSKKIREVGFTFKFDDLDSSLRKYLE